MFVHIFSHNAYTAYFQHTTVLPNLKLQPVSDF